VAWHPGPYVQLNMPVTFRALGIEEREPGALYLSPSFTEWRDPVLRRRDQGSWPKKHELNKSDTLAALARDYWGSPSEGRWVGRNNDGLGDWGIRTEIVKNKHYNVGDTIMIPEKPGPVAVGRAIAL